MGIVSTFAKNSLIVIFLFMIGSMSGWIIELIFRRFFSKNNPERKWINPGFLVGPCLPLYGCGLVATFALSLIPYMNGEPTAISVIFTIILMGILMTLIEYIAGVIFIKYMHVKLWDYSNEWGNFQGIICPLFSFFWTVMSAMYYFLIQPHVVKAVKWFTDNLIFCFFVGIFVGVFIVDIGYSLKVVKIVKEFAVEHEIIIKYDELRTQIRHAAEEGKEKVQFLFTFKSEGNFKNHLMNYITLAKSEIENVAKENIEKAKENLEKAKENIEKDIEETKNKIYDGAQTIKNKGKRG